MPTEFANKVYAYVRTIPKGKISTYKQVAVAIGSPNASRAVGTALKNNPFAPEVPCHRVVKSNFEVGSFFGISNSQSKVEILTQEGIQIVDGKISSKAGYRQKILFT
jgi:methylated-DNA-[protein]-cysteine S-methyltransferase